MAFATIGDQRIYFEDTGGEGPALVFSHGFLMDHEMFEPQVDAFRARHRCISWDMRNHGQSDGPDKSYSVQDVANDLAGLLDELAVERAVAIGFSFGGWVSVRLALGVPGRVVGLAVLDSYERMEAPETIDAYRAFKTMILEQGFTDEVAATMRGFLFHPDFDATRWMSKWRARSPLAWDNPYEAMFTRDDVNPRLGEIVCPSIVVHGEGNPANGFDVSLELAGKLGNSRGAILVPGAGHTSNLESPEFVNGVLAGFFAGLA